MVARKLDYYLREAETIIRSDHLPLKSFLLKNTKNDKVNNWGLELASKYTLNFEYVKGIINTLADTMSRLVTLDPDIRLTKEPEGYQFGKQIESEGNMNHEEVTLISLAPVALTTKTGNPTDPIPDKDVLTWGISPEEIIQRQIEDKFCQNIRNRISQEGPKAVHPYYMEGKLLMHYIEDNKQRFEVIFIPKGNKYALTVICMLSGWTWCIPIPDKTAPVVVKAYLKHVHHVFGPSRKILSDNGTEFSNKLFETVAKGIGVEHKIYSPPYRPQSNGRIEGFHSFLKTCLAKHVSPNVEWDEVCTLVTAAYNFLPNEHSRESLFFIMFGRDPRLPLAELFQHRLRYLGTDETVLSLQALWNMYLIIAEYLRKARQEDTTGFDKKITPIQPNQLVTLKVHIRRALDPRYEGTYRVIQVKGNQVEIAHNGTVTH